MGARSKAVDPRREEFLKKAIEAYDQMFGVEHQEQLITFTQREERAVELSRKLGLDLLEKHICADVDVASATKAPAVRCPKCHQVAEAPVSEEEVRNGSPPERELETLTGKLRFSRTQHRCPKCRVVFFPLGPQTPVGKRRLQSARVSKDSEARRESCFVPGGQ